MIALIITLVSIVAYFAIGVLSCRYTVPRGIARSYKHNKKQFHYEDTAREWSLFAGGNWRGLTVFFWPLTVPITVVASLASVKPIESYAPWHAEEQRKLEEKELRQKQLEMKQREREILRLERDLGIRGDNNG